jgi:hypothetical protein
MFGLIVALNAVYVAVFVALERKYLPLGRFLAPSHTLDPITDR